ncbi:MAG: IS3 family transposase [Lachnospiraceae bacterium]|nr:IS3 family transposase [Lachnospiraceae bacterium]MBQ9610954.1 IS3 family transposase [Lachnospiraceae bacterium]
MDKPNSKYEIIHEIISQEGNLQNISELCEIAGVSRSGYYYWLHSSDKRAEKETRDQADFELILQAYQFRGYDKGIRGIHMRLLHMNPPIIMNTKKIQRLMHKYGLKCPIRKANPYRRMAKAIKTDAIADNLLQRQFKEHGPRKVLLTDITYIPCCGVFFYLSVIKDAYTMQILAHVLSESLELDFVLETVNILIENHGVTLDDETLIHSDQGCHYTSKKFREIVKDYHLRQSMSRRGNCWDNAPQESFFGHMKDEIMDKIALAESFADAKAIIDDYIDYYNNDRGQWQLAKLSPNEYYSYITTGHYPLITYDGAVPVSPFSTQDN